MEEFMEKLISFLKEYIEFPDGAFTTDKDTSALYVAKGISFLIANDVFTPEEMRNQALADYGIIIPWAYFGIDK